MTQPKYLLAAHGGKEWVVRSRNPFLVGEVIDLGGNRISFDLYPQAVVLRLTEAQIGDLTDSMARWYQHAKGTPWGRS